MFTVNIKRTPVAREKNDQKRPLFPCWGGRVFFFEYKKRGTYAPSAIFPRKAQRELPHEFAGRKEREVSRAQIHNA